MTIEAELPDGRVLEFPDGTDPAIVQQTVKKMLSGEPSTQATGRQGMPTLAQETETKWRLQHNQPVGTTIKGGLLPFSRDPSGNLSFDMTAGVPGAIWDALTLPGDVVTGRTPVLGATEEGKLEYTPEVQQRAASLAALATPINPAVRAGDLAIPGKKTSLTRVTPTGDDLMQAGTKGFSQAREMGVEFSADALKNLGRDIESTLNDKGLPSELAPATHSILRRIKSVPEDWKYTIGEGWENTANPSVSGNNIISLRQSLQKVAEANAKAANKDYAAAVSAIRALDDFIDGAAGEGAVSGPAGAFVKAYQEARGNVAAAKRAGLLEKKQAIAEFRAAAANSGKNLGNTLRQRLTDLLANPEKIRGWSKEEVAALKQIVDGTGSMNAWRTLSNRLGGGGGIGQSGLAAGGAALGSVFGPWGAAVGAVTPFAAGSGSRAIYNSMVSKAVDRLEQLLLQRSPLFEQTAATIAKDPKALTAFLRTVLLAPDPSKAPTMEDLQNTAKKRIGAR